MKIGEKTSRKMKIGMEKNGGKNENRRKQKKMKVGKKLTKMKIAKKKPDKNENRKNGHN